MTIVIASEAYVIASEAYVIASEAKQSTTSNGLLRHAFGISRNDKLLHYY